QQLFCPFCGIQVALNVLVKRSRFHFLELDVSLQCFGKYCLRILLFAVLCASITAFAQSAAPASASHVMEPDGGPGPTTGYSTSKSTSTAGATKQSPKLASANGIPVDDSYHVGVEDDLQISVWREPEISSQVTVRPDKFISLPLLNDIQAEGLTTKQLQ